MKIETKIECYRETYNMLKSLNELSDFCYPAKKKHLDYSCICGDTLISFRLFSDKELLQLRAEKQCKNTEDEVNDTFVKNILKSHTGLSGGAYSGKAILLMNVPFPSVSDLDAKSLVLRKTKDFVDIIINEFSDKSATFTRIDNENDIVIKNIEDNIPCQLHEAKIEDKNENAIPEKVADIMNQGDKKDISSNSSVSSQKMNNEVPNIFSSISDNFASTNIQSTSIEKQKVDEQITIPNDEKTEGLNENKSDPIFSDTSYLDDEGTISENDKENNSPKIDKLSDSTVKTATDKMELDDVDFEPPKSGSEKTVYDSMMKAFQFRKEQLDYRESLLGKQKTVFLQEKENLESEKKECFNQKKWISEENKKIKKKWEQYNNAKAKLDERDSAISKKENALMRKDIDLSAKEVDLKKRADELSSLDVDLINREEQLKRSMNLCDKRYEDSAQRDVELQQREKQLALQEQKINLQFEQMELERKTIEEKMSDLREMEQMISQLKWTGDLHIQEDSSKEINTLKLQIKKLNNKIKKAKQQILAIQDSAKAHVTEENRLKHENIQLRKKIDELKTVVIQKESESEDLDKNQYEEQITKMKEQIQELKTDLEFTRKQVKELENAETKSVEESVFDILKDAGYNVEPISGEGDPLLTFTLDGCNIIINECLKMACVEKQTKRNYSKTFDEWNSQSFAETYSMSRGKAYCRFVYDNLVEDIQRIAAKLTTLK